MPLIQKTPKQAPPIPIGMLSDGTEVSFSFEDAPLFVTHPDRTIWHSFLSDLGLALGNQPDINWIIYGSRVMIDALSLPKNSPLSRSLCVQDDPESGNIPNRKSLVKELYDTFKHHKIRKKSTKSAYLICVIDDLWELLSQLDRAEGKKLLKVILQSHSTTLHLVLGSSPGNRMLLRQIFESPVLRPKKNNMVPYHQRTMIVKGTEIILGTEGLIFKTTPGGNDWEKWYAPVHWGRAYSVDSPPQNPNTSGKANQEIPPEPARPQEDEALIFVID